MAGYDKSDNANSEGASSITILLLGTFVITETVIDVNERIDWEIYISFFVEKLLN